MDYWDCSDVLKGEAEPNSIHSDLVPFAERNIKTEAQLSAHGESTRPRTIKEIMEALEEFKKRTEGQK